MDLMSLHLDLNKTLFKFCLNLRFKLIKSEIIGFYIIDFKSCTDVHI